MERGTGDLAAARPTAPSVARNGKTRQVTGVASSTDLLSARKHGYGSKIEIGTYLFTPKGPVKRREDVRRILLRGVPCPLCRGPLYRLDPRDGTPSGRVIAIRRETAEQVDVVLDPVPPDQWTGHCWRCRVGFGVPKASVRKGARVTTIADARSQGSPGVDGGDRA